MARFAHRNPAPEAAGSGYQRFRSFLREDFEKTCHWCVLEELWTAGEESAEVDHFRPKHLFPDLAEEYTNLYYACHRCNHRKGAHWPDGDLQARGVGYVDLCADDYETHYRMRLDGSLETLSDSAQWTVQTIRLNSPHLVQVRRLIAELTSQAVTAGET